MPKRRKTRLRGVLTVIVLIFGAALLIIVGNWVKGDQRTPPPGVVGGPAENVGGAPGGEIKEDERRELERILAEKKR